MHLKSLKLLQLILIFYIKSCLSQSNKSTDICDCNCDVQIGVIQSLMDKMESQETLVKEVHAHSLQQIQRLPNNCMEAAAGSFQSGIYKIQLKRFGPFSVWCDEDNDFGGWIVIQRRMSADVNFTRDWKEYKDGFGDVAGDYWIGLEKLHALTTSCEQELYIQMEAHDGKKYHMKYDLFVVGSEEDDYVLQKVGDGKGNVEDYFENHEGSKFSTHDRENDADAYRNCARSFRGGWWYHKCYWCNLNGEYSETSESAGIYWRGISKTKPLKFVQMMIRPTEKCMKRLSMKSSSL